MLIKARFKRRLDGIQEEFGKAYRENILQYILVSTVIFIAEMMFYYIFEKE